MNVFMRIGFASTIKLVSFDKGQVVIFNGKFVSGSRNSDCGTGSQRTTRSATHIGNSSVSSTKSSIQSTFSNMMMEIDARPSSPTLMTSVVVVLESQEREITGNPQINTQTPTYPMSNIASTSRTQTITLLHPDTQVVDEAFVMANYSKLEPLVRRPMKELRLRGVAARFRVLKRRRR
ncbi:hypothetical protein Tco_0439704 [Tanacetum coccineum]